MNVFFNVLTQNILPIVLVASLGYYLRRRLRLDVAPLSSAVFNVLSPCLVFSALVSSRLPATELATLAAFTFLNILAAGCLAFGLSRILRLDRPATAALMLVVMFVNGGNYGLTLLNLRYGEAGLARGVVYYVTSTVLLYTLGVFLASLGRLSWQASLRKMTRVPAVYATVLALIVYGFGLTVPTPIMSGIEIAGAGAIPVMLLVLGMQVADLQRGEGDGFVWPAVGLRLLGGPVIGVVVAGILGLVGIGRSAMIVESAMPPAVINLVVANEFGLPTGTVARIVVFGTLLSPLTIAATITILGL